MSLDIKKLQQSNIELRAIIDSSWDAIGIIDEKSKFIYCNKAFTPILGFSKEELLSYSFEALINENYKEQFFSLIKNYEVNNNKEQVNLLCQRKDKQNVYLQITLTKMNENNFFIINAKDITSQVSKDQILDAYVPSLQLNVKGLITKVSSSFCALSMYNKKELLGKSLEVLCAKKDQALYFHTWQQIQEKNEYVNKLIYIKKDEKKFIVDIKSKKEFNKYGDVIGYAVLFFDRTSEYDLQSEIQQKDEILLQQSKLAIMGETIQMVSHEWRQPLNVISLLAQTMDFELELDESVPVSDIRSNFINIKEKVDSLSQTIENFQSIISLKSLISKTTSKEIISQALKIFENSEDFKDIDFAKILTQTPDFFTYKNELSSILVNILINSKEAIFRNKIKNGVILLKEYQLNDNIYFEISDNAGGVASSMLDKVFEPYFSTKVEQHGVGLGLYTCKMLIQMHLKGKISIKNHNTGLRVTIIVPLNQEKKEINDNNTSKA